MKEKPRVADKRGENDEWVIAFVHEWPTYWDLELIDRKRGVVGYKREYKS